MAINVSQSFHRTSANAVDDPLTLSKAEMKTVNDNLMPSKYLTICQDDGFIYLYDKSNTVDSTTGKFRKFEGGGGSLSELSDVSIPSSIGDGQVLKYDSASGKWKNQTDSGVQIDDSVLSGVKTWSSSKIGQEDAKNYSINDNVAAISDNDYIPFYRSSNQSKLKGTWLSFVGVLKDTFQQKLTAGSNITIDANNNISAVANVDGFFNKSDLFSTTEKVVGCWVDGTPIYQRTFNIAMETSASGTVTQNFDIVSNIPNIKDIVKMDVIANLYDSANPNVTMPLPLLNVVKDEAVSALVYRYKRSGNTPIIEFTATIAASGRDVLIYITIRYTKTTDSANSFNYANMNEYSTSEKIVGTWVDGSNLYQRTFTGTTSSNKTDLNITSFSSSWIVRKFDGSFVQSSGVVVPINYNFPDNNNTDWMCPVTEGGYLKLYYGTNNYSKSYWLTVQYTK